MRDTDEGEPSGNRAEERSRSPDSIRSLPSATWETIVTGASAWLSNGMILPLLLVYLTTARDLSPGFAGTLLTVATLLGLAAQPVGGYLVDHIGPARAFSVALAINASGTLLLAWSEGVVGIAIACVIVGVGRQVSSATGPALLFSSVPDRAQYPVASAAQYMVTNACSGAGGLIGGFAANPDRPSTFTLLFLIQVVMLFSASLAIWFRLGRRVPGRGADLASSRRTVADPDESTIRVPTGKRRRFLPSDGPLGNYAFRWAFATTFLFTLFGNQQLFSGLPLHITRIGERSTQVVGIAFAANTYTIVVVQVLALHLLRRRERATVVKGMFGVLVLGWISVLIADQQTGNLQAAGYILTASLIGMGEVMLTLTVPPIPALVAPPHQLGRYLSSYSMSRGIVQVIAPIMAGLLVDPLGGAFLPALLGTLAIAAGFAISRSARKLPEDIQRI